MGVWGGVLLTRGYGFSGRGEISLTPRSQLVPEQNGLCVPRPTQGLIRGKAGTTSLCSSCGHSASCRCSQHGHCHPMGIHLCEEVSWAELHFKEVIAWSRLSGQRKRED